MTNDKNIGIIGTGRLGGALALGLKRAGYTVRFLASKTNTSAEKIAQMTAAELMNPPFNELNATGLIFITTPDQTIPEIVKILSHADIDWNGKTVIHCSGALTTEILKPLADEGAKTLTLHPSQTFPPEPAPHRFNRAYFAVEGEDYSTGEAIVRALGGIPFQLKRESKILYHAAACFASNYLYGLASAAKELMSEAGIDKEESLKILLPLMLGTIDSIGEYGIEEGLTGPIARGDTEIIEKHLSAMENYPEIINIYKTLARWLMNTANLNQDLHNRMKEILRNH